MDIRRTIYYDIITDSLATRAVAMSLFVKRIIKSSAIPNFTYNKLHIITRLHAKTCRRYLRVLLDMGLAEFVGKYKRTLVFKRLASRRERKNVSLGTIVGNTVKQIEYSLFAIFNVEIIKHKEFAKQVIATATDGHHHVKEAKRKARDCGYGRDFIERGLSLKTIAKRLKCGLQKAQNIIKFCVSFGFLVKHRNYIQIYDSMARQRFKVLPDNFTFATKNNLYIMFANTYTLGCRYADWCLVW